MVDENQLRAEADLADIIELSLIRLDVKQISAGIKINSSEAAQQIQAEIYEVGKLTYEDITKQLEAYAEKGYSTIAIKVPRWKPVLDEIIRRIKETSIPIDGYHPEKWRIAVDRLRKMDDMQKGNYCSNYAR